MQTAIVVNLPNRSSFVQPKIVAHPRPFSTYYYSVKDPDAKGVTHDRIGRASTDVGAIRAAVVNVLIGKYASADVYGVSGVRMYRIRSGRNCIEVLGYFKHLWTDA